MDPYDSDSSGLGDESEYSETGVLLGYAAKEPTEDTSSHLGGYMTCLDPISPPPIAVARCKVCNSIMSLLLQLNGDLPEHFPNDERRLYILGCRRKACNRKPGSVRALRCVRKHKAEKPAKSQASTTDRQKSPASLNNLISQNIGASLFGTNPSTNTSPSNANPFSTSTTQSSPHPNPFAPLPPPSTLAAKPSQRPPSPPPSSSDTLPETFAQKARISPTERPPPSQNLSSSPWPPDDFFPPPYPHLYLDADYETLTRDPTGLTSSISAALQGSSSFGPEDTGSDTKDAFESALDRTFLRFSDRLAQNPEQVLRYEFRGRPLLYSTTDAVGKLFHTTLQQANVKVTTSATGTSNPRIPRCETCGKERVFELQLVPHAITVLEEDLEGVGPEGEGMEWGTVILGVCCGNCGDEAGVSWREEWVGVQWEELVIRK